MNRIKKIVALLYSSVLNAEVVSALLLREHHPNLSIWMWVSAGSTVISLLDFLTMRDDS